jgi:hypothetical protein
MVASAVVAGGGAVCANAVLDIRSKQPTSQFILVMGVSSSTVLVGVSTDTRRALDVRNRATVAICRREGRVG